MFHSLCLKSKTSGSKRFLPSALLVLSFDFHLAQRVQAHCMASASTRCLPG